MCHIPFAFGRPQVVHHGFITTELMQHKTISDAQLLSQAEEE
jgi:hypothetical protein